MGCASEETAVSKLRCGGGKNCRRNRGPLQSKVIEVFLPILVALNAGPYRIKTERGLCLRSLT